MIRNALLRSELGDRIGISVSREMLTFAGRF